MQVRNEENKEVQNPGSGQKNVTNVRVRNKPTNLKNWKTVFIRNMKAYGGVGE